MKTQLACQCLPFRQLPAHTFSSSWGAKATGWLPAFFSRGMKLPRNEQPWCTKNVLKPGEIDEREIPPPPVEPGEKEGALKYNQKREFILRTTETGELKYMPTLRPGITSAMAFGFRRGKKRGLFMYKGHLSPYLRVDPRSPLKNLIIPEDQITAQKSMVRWWYFFFGISAHAILFLQELLTDFLRKNWPVYRKRPKVSWEQLAIMAKKGELPKEESEEEVIKRKRRK